MTLARLVVEIRRRAGDLSPLRAPEHAVATLIGLTVLPVPGARALRRILVALAHSHAEPEFDQAEIDALGLMAIGALERLFEGMMDRTCTDRMLRELPGPAVGKQAQ